MGYTAGTLDLSIIGASDKAVASIDKTVKSLNSLSRAIGKINASQTVFAGNQLTLLFEKIAIAANKLDARKLSNFASAAKSLGAVSKIGNLDKIDYGKVSSGFGKLTVAITPFIAKVKEAETSLTALYGILNKSSGKKIGNLLNGGGQGGGLGKTLTGFTTNFSRFFKVASWSAVLYSARRLGGYMAQIVQYGADYTETLNLWQTAMGGNLNIATEFVNKMNEAYGISEKTLMNAQAIFKNMLGSLGEISDTTAYALSEGITQMALDYASLYNVTFEQAFTKFQAALAGQVRPIRSVSGYDITENTLFQLYQELGGTKTMRQLSRTEKQLLAIYAIFNQMDKSGAIGDLDKTMERYANQSRVMAEAWQRVLTYSGLILTHLIQESQLMTYLNAILIFVGDTLMAVAESMGAVKSFGDIFESTTEGALDANEAIDEVQGKLLGFDKFRSLSGNNEENALGLDEKVLEKLAQFQSILGGASMEAKELADEFKISSGLFDENGVFNEDTWEDIKDGIKSVTTVVSTLLLAFGLISKIPNIGKILGVVWDIVSKFPGIISAISGGGGLLSIITGIGSSLFGAETMGAILTFLTSTPGLIITIVGLATIAQVAIYAAIATIITAIYSLLYLIDERFSKTVNDFIGVIGSLLWDLLQPMGELFETLFGLFKQLLPYLTPVIDAFSLFTSLMLAGVVGALEAIVKAISTLIYALDALLSWNWEGFGEKIKNLWSDFSVSKDFADNVAQRYNLFADGGLPDKGTMFVAGEAGAEMVYNMPSGQSGVANIKQIEQAMYNALARHSAEGNEPIVVQAYLDGEKVYENTTSRAKSRGKVWANV